MKLNQLTLISYAIDGDSACFILDTTLATAVALDGQSLKVTTDTGDDVAAMDGHKVVAAVKQDDGYVALHTARELDPQTAESIKALEANLAVAKQDAAEAQKAADAAQDTADAAQQKATDTEGAAAELGVIASQAISDGTDTQAAVAELGGMVAELTVRVAALESAKG